MNPILSICVVTMNRAEQLKEALQSCLACKLPDETEFVIVDNASTDNTAQTVENVLKNCGYPYIYKGMNENLGCGGGRNKAFSLSGGQFFYMLDDDAVIDFQTNADFFVSAIDILKSNSKIVSLTTQIYDEKWKNNRLSEGKYCVSDGVYMCKMFCGGSHFLRKSFFENPPYLANKYGYEELIPSFRIWDAKHLNVYVPALRVIHKPKIDKWNLKNQMNSDIILGECAIPFAVKKMLFPSVFYPILYSVYALRCCRYLSQISDGRQKADRLAAQYTKEYGCNNKIRFATVCALIKKFGFGVL